MKKKGFTHELQKLRGKIDNLDVALLDLLNQRAAVAREVGELKTLHGEPAFVPERERDLVDRLVLENEGPLPEDSLRVIYKEIMSASRALEQPLDVVYLGPEATFTHEATKRHFGLSARLSPRRAIAEVFDDVERGRAAFGVVPIENSTEGVVNHTLDMFMTSELSICAEVLLEVNQQLLFAGNDILLAREIQSHPHAFAQCRTWLERYAPGIPLKDAPSTAAAARRAAEDPSIAAIASELASYLYEVPIAARNIQDLRGNLTRFLVIGHDVPKPTRSDRTSIMFALKDAPGILYEALAPFATSGINLSRIESRPSRRRAWDYLFFIDLEGHRDEARVAKCIAKLSEACVFIKVLGSYPLAKLPKRSR